MSVLAVGFGESAGYQTQRSLRLRASASASASRTPAVAGNGKLLARRFRIKRGSLGSPQVIASAGTASIDRFYFDSSDRLCLDVLGTARLVTTPLLRDPTAWGVDIGFELDVANATAGSRAKILIDGIEATYSTDSRASITNTDTNWNNTVIHYLGRDNAGNYFDGYMAEPLGVDGSKAVSSYSVADPVTSQRVAAKPYATYGTNGFYLDFSDPTSLTTLMVDRSGNGNNWTASNISLTAGAAYDSMLDVPLGAGGQERGNYAVVNPLDSYTDLGLTDGNLRHVASNRRRGPSTIAMSSGKWYWEITPQGTGNGYIGISQSFRNQYAATDVDVGYYAGEYSYRSTEGAKFSNNSLSSYGASYAENDVIGTALDLDSGTLTFYKNGVSQGVAFTGISGEYVACACAGYTQILTYVHNYGQRPFAYTPPVGFKALHTGNLTNITPIASGSFTGDLSADGPFIWCNGTPDTLTINGNSVTWGTHADKTAGGFKLRTSSSSYNSSGTNTWTATYLSPSTKSAFKYQNAKGNP